MIGRLLRAVVGCRHPHTLRVRQRYQDVEDVLCFVCQACGHVEPAVSRTPEERRAVHHAGQALAPKVEHHAFGAVVDLRTKRGDVVAISSRRRN